MVSSHVVAGKGKQDGVCDKHESEEANKRNCATLETRDRNCGGAGLDTVAGVPRPLI